MSPRGVGTGRRGGGEEGRGGGREVGEAESGEGGREGEEGGGEGSGSVRVDGSHSSFGTDSASGIIPEEGMKHDIMQLHVHSVFI